MTQSERAEIVERTIERCSRLGAELVADDKTLYRLLVHLGIDTEGRQTGDHLSP